MCWPVGHNTNLHSIHTTTIIIIINIIYSILILFGYFHIILTPDRDGCISQFHIQSFGSLFIAFSRQVAFIVMLTFLPVKLFCAIKMHIFVTLSTNS